ncbi:HalOD1 output domain-containing protein [Halorussus sp. AFM4]|uniref:HalOD1 output domain-containing protein n=1 Tax=Halorussus sp. AFM4 TaxID=3421651 RepID=UPI003EBC6407
MTSTSDAGDGWRTGDAYYYRAADDESLSAAVVRAVAAVSDRSSAGDPREALDPLYDSVDPDALDALFRHADDSQTGAVEFAYCGYEVTVDSTGLVTVTE